MGQTKGKISLSGVLRIEAPSGENLNLKSLKAQGLLALLATAPHGERSRAWLQDKLWSDRGAEQASGSLRQSLLQVRKVLAPAKISMKTDRQKVTLDLSTVEIVDDWQQEFLEGIDIRDEEFERWLSHERGRRESFPFNELQSPPTHQVERNNQWHLAVLPQTDGTGLERWFENLFADSLGRSLRELFSASVSVGTVPSKREQLITITAKTHSTGENELSLRVTSDHPSAGHQLWSGNMTVHKNGTSLVDHPDLLRLVNQLIEAIGDYLTLNDDQGRMAEDPDNICRFAIRSLFSMNPQRLIHADSQLEQAFKMNKRGLYLAWRAQLRAIQSIEKHSSDKQALRDEGIELCEKAFELEPNNSMVLAALANSLRRFDRDDHRSLAMARRSVQLNRANPMAWWAVSAAEAYLGGHRKSYEASLIGRRLALLSPDRFWWDCQMFVSALPNGKIKEAIKFAEQCWSENPKFRPPLRYLIALYASTGRTDEAFAAVEKLKILEPDFSVDRLIRDPDYPASMVYQAPGFDSARLGDLL